MVAGAISCLAGKEGANSYLGWPRKKQTGFRPGPAPKERRESKWADITVYSQLMHQFSNISKAKW